MNRRFITFYGGWIILKVNNTCLSYNNSYGYHIWTVWVSCWWFADISALWHTIHGIQLWIFPQSLCHTAIQFLWLCSYCYFMDCSHPCGSGYIPSFYCLMPCYILRLCEKQLYLAMKLQLIAMDNNLATSLLHATKFLLIYLFLFLPCCCLILYIYCLPVTLTYIAKILYCYCNTVDTCSTAI